MKLLDLFRPADRPTIVEVMTSCPRDGSVRFRTTLGSLFCPSCPLDPRLLQPHTPECSEVSR